MSDSETDEASKDAILREQTEYYRTRGAAVSDDWFYRRGKYDHGPVINRQWFSEGVELIQALLDFQARGKVLELGGGTGFWTQHIAPGADQVTVVEVSPESIAASRTRLGSFARKVKYVEADVYEWRPAERYDVVFFAFWLTHVPPHRIEQFWRFVQSCLTPRGRVFLMDNLRSRQGIASDHRLPREGEYVAIRRREGRDHRVFKTFSTPASLSAQLVEFGWTPDFHATREFFLYGSAERVD